MNFMDTQPAPLGGADGLDPFAAFRIESPREIAALMRQLMDGATPVSLSTPDGTSLGRFTLAATFDAALVDDARVCHGVTPVQAVDPQASAHRDVLVVTFRAEQRRAPA